MGHSTIQVDVDGAGTMFRHSGPDPAFTTALPRFLEIFRKYGIKATFFATGKDILKKENQKIVKKLLDGNHEIASHSFSHNVEFMALSKRQKEEEITKTEDAMKKALGIRPAGFRAPGYSIDSETLNILEKRGYLYDSSVLPSYAGVFINALDNIALKKNYKTRFGKPVYSFAPLKPYMPDEDVIWKSGKRKIMEIPVTTCPFLRIPFHSSFVFSTSLKYFDFCFSLVKLSNLPLNYVFHAVDLMDKIGKGKGGMLYRTPALNMDIGKKEKVVSHILNKMTNEYKIITTKDYAEKIKSQTMQ